MISEAVAKEHVIREIRRIAEARGGYVSLASFLKASGIPEKQILGRHFATWNDALREARIEPRQFQKPRYPEGALLDAVAGLIVRLGKWPTENELRLERQNNRSFPSLQVVRRHARSGELAPRLLKHCDANPRFAPAIPIIRERAEDKPEDSGVVGKSPIVGYVYMMRSGLHYKIGFTNSPTRRHREVRLELPEPTRLVHSIETDDPSGIEQYWHRRFSRKQVRDTEFFALDANDVAAFKRRKYQ